MNHSSLLTTRTLGISCLLALAFFDPLEPNTSLFGEAKPDGAILKLNGSGVGGAFGAYAIDLVSIQTLQSFQASWKSLVGGAIEGSAGGYSFNGAADLPDPRPSTGAATWN